MSRDIHKEVTELLDKRDIVNRHSFFQMKHFIINKEPTHQSRLWQCLRELKVRKEAIDSIKMELEDADDNLKLTEIEMKSQIKASLQRPGST